MFLNIVLSFVINSANNGAIASIEADTAAFVRINVS